MGGICWRTMPGPLSVTVTRKRVAWLAGGGDAPLLGATSTMTTTSGRMPASSHASSALSTASLTQVRSALRGLSKPSRWRFLVKNSETEISRWRAPSSAADMAAFGRAVGVLASTADISLFRYQTRPRGRSFIVIEPSGMAESSYDHLHTAGRAQHRLRHRRRRGLRTPPPGRGRSEPSGGLRARVRARDGAGGAGRGPRAGAAGARVAGARTLEPPAGCRRLVQLRRRAGAGQPDRAAGGRAPARLHTARRGRPAGIARGLPREEARRAPLLPRLLVTVLHGGAPRAWSAAVRGRARPRRDRRRRARSERAEPEGRGRLPPRLPVPRRPRPRRDAALWPGARGRGAERAGCAAPRHGRAGPRRVRTLVLGQPELPGAPRPGRRPSRRARALVRGCEPPTGGRRRGWGRMASQAA